MNLDRRPIPTSSGLAPHFDTILKFYASWTKLNLSQIGLLVWGDDVAIGNDNDPTTFGRSAFSSANLLLNCLYYQDLLAAAELAHRLACTVDHDSLKADADALAQRIRKYSWDPRDSFFYTVDVQCVDRRAELLPKVAPGMDMSWKSLPLRLQVFTGFLPMCQPARSMGLLLFSPLFEDRASSSRGSSQRPLISRIFAGRNRTILIRRELPLTVVASPAEPVA